ncbi:MAG TPA: DMT family transporter [Nitrososphaerales archaeon]|nr:DMT family transporter [Nitrososphaerales archaeon]
MPNPAYALVASLIWAFSPIYYRAFMRKFDFLQLNLMRTSLGAAALAVPALLLGFGTGTGYALLSGLITLAVGDSLFLLSIGEMGASIATPVVYTYVLFVQLTATTVGETVPAANVLAALMVVAGVFLISRGGGSKPRAKGIALGISAGLVWTAGQDLIRVATNAGGNVVVVAFGRDFAAALALAAAVIATGRMRAWPKGFTKREYGFLALIAVSDLALGSLLYVYSISVIGVAVTVILTSLSPLLTQILSKALGKESPSMRDFAGGALIVAAVTLAVIL